MFNPNAKDAILMQIPRGTATNETNEEIETTLLTAEMKGRKCSK